MILNDAEAAAGGERQNMRMSVSRQMTAGAVRIETCCLRLITIIKETGPFSLIVCACVCTWEEINVLVAGRRSVVKEVGSFIC